MSTLVMSSPIRPVPFLYDDDQGNTPDLDDEEFDQLTGVLKALARGSYPRLDSVPLALNAYNCNRRGSSAEQEPWAYFHPVTVITPEEVQLKQNPLVLLDDLILDDLKKPWLSIRTGDKFGQARDAEASPPESGSAAARRNSAQYRFICFIHKHRIDRRCTSQKGVHTISIWDREWDELTYHDTYHVNRAKRRREIKRFWTQAAAPGFLPTPGAAAGGRQEFLDRIRYRTVYHVSERLEDTLREAVPPRHTLWAVLGAALFHMNGARDPQVSIVPDRLELFGAHARGLLPRFFAHLLWLCLDCRPHWSPGRRERYVRQFRIMDRLRWMKTCAREHLARYGEREWEVREVREASKGGSEWGSEGGGEGGDSEMVDEQEGSRDWLYAILKI
ncbi:hypothetical protein F4818DRAFT_180118 [Hypoxylon cercidicola]|nr:hypothetical protein F4818DRAFT_180118 [Hypoxylon cercidicola]